MNAALAGLVILVIGDSQTMNLMTNLDDQLERAGAAVHAYAMCGSTAADWLLRGTISCGMAEQHGRSAPVVDPKPHATWNLDDLVARHHPNMIIVQLGDTMAGYGAQMERPWIDEQVHALTGKIRADDISCVWIGPTWGQESAPYHKTVARVTEMSQYLAASVSPCHYIDSTAFSRPGEWATRDGAHLAPDAYRRWAKDLADAIVRLQGKGAS